MERERQRAQTAEHDAHQRSIQEWEAQVKARELDNAALPCGPPPAGTSSMRVLPNVHEALRQNDPKTTSYSQPAVKKAPPTTGRPRPCAFYSDAEPPRIGAPVQPPPPAVPRPSDASSGSLLLAATPMTPSHPPRPPIDALPEHPSMEMNSGANKHPLEPPTAQAPPSKHVRCKAFPQSSQPPDQVYVAASAAVEMPKSGRPCPKGPPAEFMPTPPEIASMQPSSTDDRISRMNDEGKYLRVKSAIWISTGVVLYGNNLHQFSREVQARTVHQQIYVLYVPRSLSAPINCSMASFHWTMSSRQRRRTMVSIRSTCVKQQHGSSMVHIGSAFYNNR